MAAEPDAFTALGDGPEVEIKIKGSRFLGQVFSVGSESEARERLESVRRRYHDATHHCSAYRVGDPDQPSERYHDDGEPSGTAGAPMLNVLAGAEVTDALVVVTRYYGGTKLGTGGLARAYAEGAREAIAAAPPVTRWRSERVRVTFAYGDLGAVENVVHKSEPALLEVERLFDGSPQMILTLKASRAEGVKRALVDATGGRITLEEAQVES